MTPISTFSISHKLWLSLVCLALAVPALQAQPKIATINLQKVFDNYYKTRQADANLKERAADLDKVQKGMLEEYQTANEQFKKLRSSVDDPAISQAEREKRQTQAKTKLEEIQELEAQIQKFRNQAQSQLQEQQRRLRDNLLRQIQEIINTKAKTAGYTLVIDTASEAISNTPIILYSDGSNDITDQVLTQLNQDAPEDLPSPDPSSSSDSSDGLGSDLDNFNDLDNLLEGNQQQ
jgi:outer membrane protein